jgi:hypothetical protein
MNQPQVQCASLRSAAPRPPHGNAHTMRSNAQQAATRQRRDPASCCALAEPRRITRHCIRLPPSRRVAATFGPRLTLPRGGLRPQGRQAPPALKHEPRQRPTTTARAAVMPHAPAHGASHSRPQPPAQCARQGPPPRPHAPHDLAHPAANLPAFESSAPRRPRLTPRPPLPAHGCASVVLRLEAAMQSVRRKRGSRALGPCVVSAALGSRHPPRKKFGRL